MSKKKVVIIGPCYPYRGGIATFVSHLCKGISSRFEVHLINYSLLYPSIIFPGKTQYDESKDLIFSFPNQRMVNSINPISWYKVAQKIKELEPDLVIMDWWNPFFSFCFKGMAFFMGKKYRDKTLLIAENVVSHEGRWIDAMLTKMGISHAKSYLALSQKVVEQLAPYSGNKKIYASNLPIYNTFNTTQNVGDAKQVVGYTNSDFVLLFFGYIRKYKGLDIAIEAFPKIKEKIPNAKLLVVGECYNDIDEYKKQIEKLGIANDVQLINEYVANEDVGKYFTASDCVLLPYRTATQSGILNIAYGFLKPVVATNVGGFSEFVANGKSGVLVDSIEPNAFADGVIEWYALQNTVNYTQEIETIVAKNSFDGIADIVQDAMDKQR